MSSTRFNLKGLNQPPKSLRVRLMMLLTIATVLTLSAAVYFTHRAALQELDALFDAQMAESANVLLGLAQRSLAERIEHGTELNPITHEYEQTQVYQVWGSQGLVIRSGAAPDTPMDASTVPGYRIIKIQKNRWRLLVLWDEPHEFMIQIAEPMSGREVLARQIVLKMLFPSLAVIPLLSVLISLVVRTGLRPLRQLRREVVQRSAERLEPLSLETIPQEVSPLVNALNDLFKRLQLTIDSEKRFTSDAAHELRTPLAALRTQAQVAQRAITDEARRQALTQVVLGVERATHLIEQLLTLSRVDPEEAGLAHTPVLLRSVALELLSLLAPTAMAKNIELSLDEGPDLEIRGNIGHLRILLRNLVDNAIRYTPTDGEVSVGIRPGGEGQVFLEVRDNGPGIPELELDRVQERFYRVAGTGEQGSGLGLSIVQRIAQHHRAEVILENNPQARGLRVRVIFPEPALLEPAAPVPVPRPKQVRSLFLWLFQQRPDHFR